MKLGIIGTGKFGMLLKLLFEEIGHEVVMSSKSQNIGYEILTGADFVFPCVPIRHLQSVLVELKPFLKGNEVIVDVCSIKSYPKSVYESITPSTSIILTHPNFGPESHKLNGNSAENLNWIVWNHSSSPSSYDIFIQMLEVLKVRMIEIDPDTHDQTIGLPHFTAMLLGQVMKDLDLEKTDYQAASTKRMFEMIQGVGDDWGILHDMYQYNRYCKEFLEKLDLNFSQILKKLKSE